MLIPSPHLLEIKDLTVSIDEKVILSNFNLSIAKGEVHVLMGKNGSGKTTLAYTLMGHPRYKIQSGDILFNGESIKDLTPNERAQKRIFLGFQYPVAIPGVTIGNYLRTIIRSVRGEEIPLKDVRTFIKTQMKMLDIPESFLKRSLNDGFSGGEKKRLETLQLKLLNPSLAILDETDSGLDVDALKKVAEGIRDIKSPDKSILVITHYKKMAEYVEAKKIHILMNGKIIQSGGIELAEEIEDQGFGPMQANN